MASGLGAAVKLSYLTLGTFTVLLLSLVVVPITLPYWGYEWA